MMTKINVPWNEERRNFEVHLCLCTVPEGNIGYVTVAGNIPNGKTSYYESCWKNRSFSQCNLLYVRLTAILDDDFPTSILDDIFLPFPWALRTRTLKIPWIKIPICNFNDSLYPVFKSVLFENISYKDDED